MLRPYLSISVPADRASVESEMSSGQEQLGPQLARRSPRGSIHRKLEKGSVFAARYSEYSFI